MCSFDAFLKVYGIESPALDALALIVRGADTARLELTPQSPGLLAVSLGLSAIYADDHTMLEHGMTVYDALYAWCRDCRDQGHDWNPAAMIAAKASAIGFWKWIIVYGTVIAKIAYLPSASLRLCTRKPRKKNSRPKNCRK